MHGIQTALLVSTLGIGLFHLIKSFRAGPDAGTRSGEIALLLCVISLALASALRESQAEASNVLFTAALASLVVSLAVPRGHRRSREGAP